MVLNTKTLNATSEMLARATKGMDKRLAEHMVNIATFINSPVANGDVSTASHFIKLFPNTSGVRRQAIANWFVTFAGCTWNNEKKAFGREKGFTFDLEAAVRNPWYQFTPDKAIEVLDADKLLNALISKLTKAIENGNVKDTHKAELVLKTLVYGAKATDETEGQTETEDSEGHPEGWTEVTAGLEHMLLTHEQPAAMQ